MSMASLDSPIPLSDIETVLSWVDSFKLSRPTKKINRDFSDAVLLAEILSVHYPKLVEMHNYPPRNSHSLKLNNWMTLNRKVLKKLKLNLCLNTMEQLSNCAPGVIERVLVMVRDKIHRDEEANKSTKDGDHNMSSGGSYYEACGDEENVLVIPLKTRINGLLETVQQKVVNYESYLTLKEELKDAKDSAELLKQKVEHLDNLLKLKEEHIDELQKQLDRKQAKRKEVEIIQNNLAVPFDSLLPSPTLENIVPPLKCSLNKGLESASKISRAEESNTNTIKEERFNASETKIEDLKTVALKPEEFSCKIVKSEDFKTKIPIPIMDTVKSISRPSITEATVTDMGDQKKSVEKIKSDVFKEIEIIEPKSECFQDVEEFKDSEPGVISTIGETIQKEIKDITNQIKFAEDYSYIK